MKDDFEKRVVMLKSLGVEYHVETEYRPKDPPRKPHPLRIFRSVLPPFSGDTWCDLFMSDGDFYIGGCCGSMSALQDELCATIRMDSGWFSIEKLSEIAEIMIDHGESEKELGFGHLPPGQTLEDVVVSTYEKMRGWPGKVINPWFMLALIWHITKDHWAPKVPTSFGDHVPEVNRAVSILSNGLTVLSWDNLFAKKDDPHPQHQGNRTLLLTKLLPAWKTLNERLHDLGPQSFEGFALVEIEKPDSLCRNGHGYCLFETKEEADHLFNLWRRQRAEYQVEKKDEPPVRVRKVRISLENGVEFLAP